MSKNHEKWKCSCGTENYFRHRKCRECSKPMPHSVYSDVFRSELRLITQSISDQIRVIHNDFWQKLTSPLVRGAIATRVLSFILISLFTVTLYQNSKDIRLEDIADKSQLNVECIVDNATELVLDVEWKRVWGDISSKFKNWNGISYVTEKFKDVDDSRLDDIADKAQLKAECIVDNAPTLVPDVEWQRVWVDISSKFKNWNGISRVTEKFKDVDDIFNEKIKEIESKKDMVLDYVNR